MALFIWGRWRYDVVALMALTSAVACRAVPFHSVYDGLSNPAVITVACVMILSSIVNQSPLIQIPLRGISQLTQHRTLYILSLTAFTAFLSSFMNNIGALAIMMPIAVQSARSANISPSTVLMPIALGSALGGLNTMIGTPPNLLISNFKEQATGHAFGMFSFGKVGLAITMIGVLYVGLVGWRLIPKNRKQAHNTDSLFEITDYITEARVTDNSPLVGKVINRKQLKEWGDFSIIGVVRDDQKRMSLNHEIVIEIGDILIMEADAATLNHLIDSLKLEWIQDRAISTDILKTDDISLIEAVITESSRIEGRQLNELNLRSRFHANIIAISRQGRFLKTRLASLVCRAGDVLLIQGSETDLQQMIYRLKLLPLEQRKLTFIANKKINLGILFFILAIIMTTTQLLPIQIAFGGAVFLCMVFHVIPVRHYYENINWPVIILLAAMIPLGEALQTTGGTTLITHTILHSTQPSSPIITIALLMIVTMTLSDFINNAATTIVMAPIAISLAQSLHYHSDPFLMAVAISASCSFLTPVGHQNNTIIMGPGGYRFSDYIRVGFFLQLLILLISVPMILWVWPVN
tara:strand:- start:2438 stop:4174 length:1737 start_codon:yes stop_codon:yes gene_type:complete